MWSFKRPHQPRMVVVLDHSPNPQQQQPQQVSEAGGSREAGGAEAGGRAAPEDVIPSKPSNMRWLTRSDIDGLPPPGAGGAGGGGSGGADQQQQGSSGDGGGSDGQRDLVAEAIRDAAVDIPEVTQARGWMSCYELTEQWSSRIPRAQQALICCSVLCCAQPFGGLHKASAQPAGRSRTRQPQPPSPPLRRYAGPPSAGAG